MKKFTKNVGMTAIFVLMAGMAMIINGCAEKSTAPELQSFDQTEGNVAQIPVSQLQQNNAEQPPMITTDYVRFPINPWTPLNGFAFGYWRDGHGYHLGDDCVRSAGTPVYAIWGGTVIYARNHGGGWGYIMIVQSIINNIAFCTVYGHLGSAMYPGEGRTVVTGQYIGTVGSTQESGQNPPHLHLGIKRITQWYPVGQYPSWCKGYTFSYSEKQTWINPTAFINYW